MSYGLFCQDEHIHHLASVVGMSDLVHFLSDRLQHKGPLRDFVDNGVTNNINGVVSDIIQVVPLCTDPTVKSTLLNMKEGLAKCQGTAVISD